MYTQTSDIEAEVNGMMTYDREQIKFDETRAAEAAAKLYQPPAAVKALVPCNEEGRRILWKYTTIQPTGEWQALGFDDSAWQGGPNGFGINGGTTWETSDIWLRHSFEIQAVPAKVALNIFYHADVEIYLNGKEAAKLTGLNKYHEEFPLSPDAVKLLKPGKNSIAIHCK